MLLLAVFGVVIVVSLSNCTPGQEGSAENTDGQQQEEDSGAAAAQKTEEKDSITWEIRTALDEMTDSENIWASVKSDNYVNQDFPYEGNTYASITVRYMKKYGYDVLISIDRGQIVGFDYNNSNFVTVRFDSAAPKKYYFNDAADGSTETVFLRNAKDFMEKCKKANNIKVQIPLYQAGQPIFSFHVDKPLVWPK